jgi:uncharacterized membrane protein
VTVYERLGIPSPDECVGVLGLAASLFGVTVGVAALFLLEQSLPGFAIVVGSLLIGWASFIYCVVWGESD